ncbi:ABC transporter ATP-binding protein/permease [Mycolicibacterium fluoranthenivorans]|uniref:Putative ATP-binding cassette transporter n=1 Tax=Mycolicibacterium fluoranthenivorans TaxID=258505 RepID=A0A7X5U173_9MYCO|nr:ABC transporter ATP-binding protein/permease [Mycolicibacterium fluoranthenivorans]MCV7354921.1 ABC transporter ATP-binding protein/permease [Mycolicibacterium fluoranthenivorans]NIH96489.1 putative ATP-binding cassette transporter [Mycolicibacterium fluoranthenivorans]
MDGVLLGPAIDWSTEFLRSSLWICNAAVISAVSLLVVAVLIGRTCEWGRQFWRITGAYFTGPGRLRVWLVLAALLVSTVTAVRINILLSYYTNDLFSSLQQAFRADGSAETGVHGFWAAMLIFAILASLYVARFFLDLYLTQRFLIGWRVWLTRRTLGDWLDGHAYYRCRFNRDPDGRADNPDQRIQADVDIVTTGSREPNNPTFGSGHMLIFGAVEALLTVVSFGVILWGLSGPLTVLGVTVPRALFWVVIGYVAVATLVAFVIGRPLIRLSFLNEVRNAGFRYTMIRMREAGAAVSLYRGEDAEREALVGRLGSVIDNYRHWLHRSMLFLGWNVSVSQAINPLPYIVQAQRLFAGEISFGDVMQSATAFHAVHDALSFFRNAYDEFAGFRAALMRLDGLHDANARARALPVLPRTGAPTGASEATGNRCAGLRLHQVEVRTPAGEPLIGGIDLSLDPGDWLVITGPSGCGKTALLQSLAGLWPYTSGRVDFPAGETMFVPQMPYLPLGSLRTVLCYPRLAGTSPDDEIQRVLLKVALPQLVIRLGEVADWARTLSPGEQQRIAFARILLTRPDVVFLDEASSALDEGLELTLYQLLRTELPGATVVSVSHRRSVERFHGHRLELLGGGRWRTGRLVAS